MSREPRNKSLSFVLVLLELVQVTEIHQDKKVLSWGGVSVKVRHWEDVLSVEKKEQEWTGQGYPEAAHLPEGEEGWAVQPGFAAWPWEVGELSKVWALRSGHLKREKGSWDFKSSCRQRENPCFFKE